MSESSFISCSFVIQPLLFMNSYFALLLPLFFTLLNSKKFAVSEPAEKSTKALNTLNGTATGVLSKNSSGS